MAARVGREPALSGKVGGGQGDAKLFHAKKLLRINQVPPHPPPCGRPTVAGG
jgi:hypothetical protein